MKITKQPIHLNDDATINQLVNDNLKLVLYALNRITHRNINNTEEEYEEGLYVLYRCARYYNLKHTKHATFSTYVVKSIYRAIHRLYNSQYKLRTIRLVDGLTQTSYCDKSINLVDNLDQLTNIINSVKLKPIHKTILKLRFVDGLKLREIVPLVHLSRERVRQIIEYSKRKLRKHCLAKDDDNVSNKNT